MSEHMVPLPSAAVDRVLEPLPRLFRIQSIARFPCDERHALNRAALFHERASLTVEWLCRKVDARLLAAGLVSIRWQGRPVSLGGAVRIARLVAMERPEPDVDLFQTIPHSWIKDRALVVRGGQMWRSLPEYFRLLFNAIFWEPRRLHRYLAGPSSLNGHHCELYGNFRHTLEVAERALKLAAGEPLACPAVLLMAALLHDAGKAAEYTLRRNRFELTDRGRLVGRRHTIIEWIAAARATNRVSIPEAHYLGLLHALTSARGAPEWLGLREPSSLDAALLSIADRLSGQIELMARHAPRDAGFGRYHAHLRGRPYVIQPTI